MTTNLKLQEAKRLQSEKIFRIHNRILTESVIKEVHSLFY